MNPNEKIGDSVEEQDSKHEAQLDTLLDHLESESSLVRFGLFHPQLSGGRDALAAQRTTETLCESMRNMTR